MAEIVKPEKAPVVIADPTILGDRLPRDRDSIAQKVEDTKHFREKQHKAADQDLLTDEAPAKIHYLEPFEFIRRVKKLNAALIFAWGGVQGCCKVGILTLDTDVDSPTCGKFTEVLIPGCGFRVDAPLPEFSWLETDSWGIATREGERGWRTVLLRLIKAGFLKYPAVKAEFGEPTGQRSKLWFQQLREYRQ